MAGQVYHNSTSHDGEGATQDSGMEMDGRRPS
jgi:hypothetical protein